MRSILVFLTMLVFGAAALAAPQSKGPNIFHVSVWGRDNIFAAGAGGVKSNGGGQAPVKLTIPRGAKIVEVSQASGTVSCCSGGSLNAADGGTAYKTDISSSGGISGIIAPWNMFLIGVFVGAGTPSSPAPPRLDVSRTRAKIDVYPLLDQTFFVGKGYAGKTERRIHIPAGAKTLVLGFADSNSFHGPPGAFDDNTGKLNVTVVFR